MATVDRSLIERWHAENPESNFWFLTGPHSGVVVVHVDALGRRILERQGHLLPLAPKLKNATTYHNLIFKAPGLCPPSRYVATGLSLSAVGGHVFAPGSFSNAGIGTTEFEIDPERFAPDDMPGWLLDLFIVPGRRDVIRAAMNEIRPPRAA